MYLDIILTRRNVKSAQSQSSILNALGAAITRIITIKTKHISGETEDDYTAVLSL